jgi:hypothetical protein
MNHFYILNHTLPTVYIMYRVFISILNLLWLNLIFLTIFTILILFLDSVRLILLGILNSIEKKNTKKKLEKNLIIYIKKIKIKK